MAYKGAEQGNGAEVAVTGRLGVAPGSPWQKPRARRLSQAASA